MITRIAEMANEVMEGNVWFETTPVEYDRDDLFLEPIEMQAKRIFEYITSQMPQIDEKNAFAGYLRFDGSVEGDAFNRQGHKHFNDMINTFYCKPYNNLVTFEWQHSAGNFKKVIDIGIDGIKSEIAKSKEFHTEKDKILFLNGLELVCDAIVVWANKCADFAFLKSAETNSEEYKNNLIKLSQVLRKIPQKPAESFYEAVQCIYICYPFLPDSIGLIDRHLYHFYKKDLENGTLTKEDAATYLQELFLMLQSRISIKSDRFYRGGESHFCIGGYLEDGTDGYNELSQLILEALMELPTAIPQISLRFTSETPHNVLKFAMDCERKDKYKRIAFVSDEPRLKALTDIVGFSYSDAVNYSMVGCNETVMVGGTITGPAWENNILRSVVNTFKKHENEIIESKTFDDFYKIYEKELFLDINEMIEVDDKWSLYLAKDCNLVSSIFIDGCIESAKSVTQGGAKFGTSILGFIGLPNIIDSLAIISQFVYDEKRISMQTLVDALNNNWQGYEDLRREILKKGNFFGNDDDKTNEIAQKFTDSVYRFLSEKRSCFGKKYIVGNLIGYNEHNKWFGELTPATPDGRYNGETMSFGIGQNDGKDRNGISALLNSIAKYDPNCIMTGPSVTNVYVDKQLITNDNYFEKLVYLFETYLKNGGTHFQLNYVSKDDLIKAKASPDKYKNLRVRVSGFSDFFVNLNDALQDEVISRTVKNG